MEHPRINRRALPRIVRAAIVAGTLELLAAVALTLWDGRRGVSEMLAYVASGAIPGVPVRGLPVALLGLAVLYALVAAMAAACVLAADRAPVLGRHAIVAGVGYGLVSFAVMTLLIMPWRYGATPAFPGTATRLFCHVALLGVPIALVARR